MSGPEMLPCPFCGGPAVLVQPALGRPYVACETWFCSGPQETAQDAIAAWNRRPDDPAALAASPTMQAMIPAAFVGIEERLMDAVWNALKADANDLRKQQRILRAYRALTPADAATAYARALEDARNAALDEVAARLEPGSWICDGSELAEIVRAMKRETKE